MDSKKRLGLQAVATLIQNANFKGFFKGTIYQGNIKKACVPGLNCYSCPGAVGACPIGSLQSSLSGLKFKFPYYVVGCLIFFGVLLGRLICAFLCPFGLIQDLINKIPFIKKIHRFKGDRILRLLKYVVLVFMVIILPISIKLTPFFCKYLCPSGTIAGILISISNSKIAALLGKQFVWKVCVLAMIILTSIIISRPFCKYLCPLGAIYGLFNKISVFTMDVDKSSCTNCKACQKCCPMDIDPFAELQSAECIRCGQCINACPTKAIHYCTRFSNSNANSKCTEVNNI